MSEAEWSDDDRYLEQFGVQNAFKNTHIMTHKKMDFRRLCVIFDITELYMCL